MTAVRVAHLATLCETVCSVRQHTAVLRVQEMGEVQREVVAQAEARAEKAESEAAAEKEQRKRIMEAAANGALPLAAASPGGGTHKARVQGCVSSGDSCTIWCCQVALRAVKQADTADNHRAPTPRQCQGSSKGQSLETHQPFKAAIV